MTDKPKPTHYHTDTVYQNPETGQTVFERWYFDYPQHVAQPKYLGVGTIVLQGMTAQGPIERPEQFEFAIKAETVGEAFERFEAYLKPAAEGRMAEIQAEQVERQAQQSRKLVVPGRLS